jgi:Ca2+-dependent lipid-binding protein
MSPYVKVTLGSEWKTTVAAKRQHMNPIWDQSLHFRFHGEPTIFFEVWNKEHITKDDLVAAGSMVLSNLMDQRNIHQWVPLFYKEKDAGSLLVELNFFPDGVGGTAPEGMVSQMQTETSATNLQAATLTTEK